MLFVWGLIAVVAVLIVLLNLWDRKRRSRMTPSARNVEDEEMKIQTAVW